MIIRISDSHVDAPTSLHVLVTGRCNASCVNCYYQSNSEWELDKAKALLLEYHYLLFESRHGFNQTRGAIAIGGGEPFLWPHLGKFCSLARGLGMSITITTNGTLPITELCDTIHVSGDYMHPLSIGGALVVAENARAKAHSVGINVIVSDLAVLAQLEALNAYDRVDQVVLLLQKPNPPELNWHLFLKNIETHQDKIWLDACMCEYLIARGWPEPYIQPCTQGLHSLSIGTDWRVGRCSNLQKTYIYEPGECSLKGIWQNIRVSYRSCKRWRIEDVHNSKHS